MFCSQSASARRSLTGNIADIAVLVVTLSMAATPVLTTLGARFGPKDPDIPHEETDGEPRENHVIIAGFGPFGQTVARVLATLEIPFTAIELDPGRVRFVRQFGGKIYYGDASPLPGAAFSPRRPGGGDRNSGRRRGDIA